MKLFTDIFKRTTHLDLARQRLPEAKRTLLDAYGTAEYAQAVISQKLAEIARLEALIGESEKAQNHSKPLRTVVVEDPAPAATPAETPAADAPTKYGYTLARFLETS